MQRNTENSVRFQVRSETPGDHVQRSLQGWKPPLSVLALQTLSQTFSHANWHLPPAVRAPDK